ncbi:MAG: hypoxanthine-guanine phosphoribosyltransferase [Gammaproteobacteria bacterium]|nr:hypoxanthine-guanine phosphoribosyltransferase [Gammaproteobacteria bacterium]MCI0591704.1 hypoxanthine-guanine phosphoribosyltransferase [Gammaproteobacteria bacterium]
MSRPKQSTQLESLQTSTAAFAAADLIYTVEQVEQALDRLADALTNTLKDSNPVILCVMIGGIVPTGKLLMRLGFPLQVDYLHATRYREKTSGGALQWLKRPAISLTGRTVLIVDDILDEGLSLAAIVEECKQAGAEKVYTAVLLEKSVERLGLKQADFVGLTVPNRYVFGYGMDFMGYLRNAPGIYAVKET